MDLLTFLLVSALVVVFLIMVAFLIYLYTRTEHLAGQTCSSQNCGPGMFCSSSGVCVPGTAPATGSPCNTNNDCAYGTPCTNQICSGSASQAPRSFRLQSADGKFLNLTSSSLDYIGSMFNGGVTANVDSLGKLSPGQNMTMQLVPEAGGYKLMSSCGTSLVKDQDNVYFHSDILNCPMTWTPQRNSTPVIFQLV